ncbi:hypothetical protein SDC9_158241 [bioreactor metagenome]|uniref:Uncharacterized protein n=1 Tax=bioreactor metagenome TaxID=1076179 RepID=A0A645FEY7_9ZZZZ
MRQLPAAHRIDQQLAALTVALEHGDLVDTPAVEVAFEIDVEYLAWMRFLDTGQDFRQRFELAGLDGAADDVLLFGVGGRQQE